MHPDIAFLSVIILKGASQRVRVSTFVKLDKSLSNHIPKDKFVKFLDDTYTIRQNYVICFQCITFFWDLDHIDH